MSNETRHLLNLLRERLRAAAHRTTVRDLVQGLLQTAAVITALLLAMVGVEALFWVPVAWRSLLFWLLALVLCGLGLLCVFRPLLRLAGLLPKPSERRMAKEVSARYPEVEDRLINLLDLAAGRASAAPDSFVDCAVHMLHDRVRHVPLENAPSFDSVRQAGRLASVPVASLLVFLVVAPATFLDASQRLFSPGVFFARPAPYVLAVTPGSTTLVRGETLTITATASGNRLPGALTLEFDAAQPVILTADSQGDFRYEMVNVRQGLQYRLVAPAVSTKWFKITVIERPVVRGLQLELVPPRYTGLSPQMLPAGTGDIVALAGTEVRLQVHAGAAQAFVVFASGSVDTLSQGPVSTGRFTVAAPDRYHIRLVSEDGIRNQDPIEYRITPVADLPPTVTILAPEPEATLGLDLQAIVELEAHDDFGLADLHLWWRLAESRFNEVMAKPASIPLPLASSLLPDQHVEYYWDLSGTTKIDLVPGDIVEYYALVRDNDAVHGGKGAKSAVHQLRLPSVSERYDQLSDTQLDTETEMSALLDESDRIRSQFEEVRDELRRKQEGDWDDKRQLERLAEAQKALEARVEALESVMDATANDMQDLVSEETLQKFEELREVMHEINSPELMEAMEELQQAIEALNPREMQEALKQFGFNEEMFRDRLERALELFKNFQVQQKLEEAAERAEDLAGEQEKLASEIAEDEDGAMDERESMAEDQLRNKEEMERLEDTMAEIARRMQEVRNTPQDAMKQLNEDVAAQQLPEEMQKNATKMREGSMEQARRGQQQMQQGLQQMQQQLQNILGGMQGNQLQISFAALQRLLSDILHLSHDQEALRGRVDGAAVDSPVLREVAQAQGEMRALLGTVADSLQSLARQVPQMTRAIQAHAGTALIAMEEAVAAMVARNSTQAVRHQQTSMTNLNELTLLLSDLMDQLMNTQNNNSAGGMSMSDMIQQLQQMASTQQQLNQQIQEMLGQMQGQRLTADRQLRMQQMAAQQQAIKQQLEELSRQHALAHRLAGDLNRIADQMEATVQQLGALSADRELQDRQQQILTRLLDASRAMQERGRQQRREGRTGDTIVREGPRMQDPLHAQEQLRRALLDALESGYAPDYQELIRRYFELLQQNR